jgi:hypothetical protein
MVGAIQIGRRRVDLGGRSPPAMTPRCAFLILTIVHNTAAVDLTSSGGHSGLTTRSKSTARSALALAKWTSDQICAQSIRVAIPA